MSSEKGAPVFHWIQMSSNMKDDCDEGIRSIAKSEELHHDVGCFTREELLFRKSHLHVFLQGTKKDFHQQHGRLPETEADLALHKHLYLHHHRLWERIKEKQKRDAPTTLEKEGDAKVAKLAAADDVASSSNKILERFLSTHNFLHECIKAFLSINDITNLSMTSQQMRKIVQSARSLPCIVWEERQSTKMGLACVEETPHVVSVSQIQEFQFILHTPAQESLQVEFSLKNAIWEEHDNMRDGRQCRNLNQFPFFTIPSIKIMRPKKSNQERYRVFIAGSPFIYYDEITDDTHWWIFFGEGGHDYLEEDQDWTPSEAQDLRDALDMVWKCAQRVAAFQDGTVYPSAEYLMQKLPSWLHRYFPADLAGLPQQQRDRDIAVEFTYRPARTLAEWDEFMPWVDDGREVFDPQQLPWYRDGYSWTVSNSEQSGEEESEEESDDE